MNRISRRIGSILLLALAWLACAPAARAESEQYCFDYQGAVRAQIKRGEAVGCSMEGWFWSRDAREQFDFCRRSDAREVQYWQDQRESQLRYCEVQAATQARQKQTRMPRLTVKDFRITGGPGDYTINWALDFQGCRGPQIDIDFRCFVQIRLETLPGRAGGYAHELQGPGEKEGFSIVRADKYRGGPGEVVRLKWHTCVKDNFLGSSCEPWSDLPLVMPRAVEFRPARVAGVVPNEYIPDRFSEEAPRVAQRNTGGNFHTFRVRLDGTREAFTPAPFQGGEAWKPLVRVRITHGQRVLAQTQVIDFPLNGEVSLPVLVKDLNTFDCRPDVGVSGVCTEIDVEAESIRLWMSGNVSNRPESMGKSHVAVRVGRPDPLSIPPTISSKCNATYHVGVVQFGAQQTNMDRHIDSRPIPIQLQYAAGQGLWGTSTLLEGLPVIHDTTPPGYRATLSAAQLTRLSSTWRWRIRARDAERWSNWCHFTVAAPQSIGAANSAPALSGKEKPNVAVPSVLLDPLGVPPRITSQCNATYSVGVVPFAAQQTNVEKHIDSRPITVQLQYAGGQGLWGTSTFLEGLQVIHGSTPPEYRSSLSAAKLTPLSSTWRWRVKARASERWSDWCQFTVTAPHTTGTARTPQSSSPNTLAAPTGGANTGQALSGQPSIGSKPGSSRMLNSPTGTK